MTFLIFLFFIILVFLIALFFVKKNDDSYNEVYNDYLAGDSNLILLEVGKNRVQVINLIRKYTKISKEKAEKLVSNLPAVILFHIDFELAGTIKSHFEKYGAIMEIKRDML